MVSNLAFLPFQQPSPVDNFLSAYSKGQDMAAQRANQERQKVVNQREDQTFAQDQRMKTIDQLGAVLDGVQDGDEAGFQRAKDWAVQNGLLDPNEAQRYTVAQLPQIRALSQQARQLAAQRAAAKLEQDKFDLDRRATEANIRQSDAAAAASMASVEAARRKPVGNIDPNTGVRTPPASIQSKDAAELQATRKTADAAANIAALLLSSKRAFETAPTGDSFGAQRTVAGILNAIPGYTWAERELGGSTHTRDIINSYDEISNVAIKQGIEELQKVGGSDTNMELLTAIRTAPNPDVTPEENKRRIENIYKAAEIISQKADLQTKWVSKAGSLGYTLRDQQGNELTWPKFWSQYQSAAWADHMRRISAPPPSGGRRDYRGEQRNLLNGTAPQGVPPPPPGFEVR